MALRISIAAFRSGKPIYFFVNLLKKKNREIVMGVEGTQKTLIGSSFATKCNYWFLNN